jgi:hypothetical protein
MILMFSPRYDKKMPLKLFLATEIILSLLGWEGTAPAAPLRAENIRKMVQSFKQDDRGPFQAIRWFCPDGSVLPAKERCSEPGGIQHALPKESVQALRDEQHLFLGQILAGTPFVDFLDAPNNYSRLKQYQLEKFLQAADNGWILRKARYYRGAFQAEDEEQWGTDFFRSLLSDDEFWVAKYFLLRQAVRDIPHWGGHTDRWADVRAEAKKLAELEPAFDWLRVKLHGRPEGDDIDRVSRFIEQHRGRLTSDSAHLAEKLLADLKAIYQAGDLEGLAGFDEKLPAESPISPLLAKLLRVRDDTKGGAVLQQSLLVEILWLSRLEMANTLWPLRRLVLVDLSLAAEDALFRSWRKVEPESIGELFDQCRLLIRAAAGAGYLEIWEWQEAQGMLTPFANGKASLADLLEAGAACRRLFDWSVSSIPAEYSGEVQLFGSFEPLAYGFSDDRIRSSLLLLLGERLDQLKTVLARLSGSPSRIFDRHGQAGIRGTNPGVASGPLRVFPETGEDRVYDADAICVLRRAPADLKPVAGLLTADEGNLVSHVQLLARNLGIPSSIFSPLQIDIFKPFDGQQVFYAVSPRGRVILKPVGKMTAGEQELVSSRRASRIEQPAILEKEPDLSKTDILSLRTLRASDSGRICGPKAANLGQLKKLFPDRVADGLVVPFGLFRKHLAQLMPGQQVSYWRYLQETFAVKGGNVRDDADAEKKILKRLAFLRQGIRNIRFIPGFTEALAQRFEREFRRPIGELGVFVRSDTNMEDLKEFTGAGLNLTVFNVVPAEAVLQAIRDVWASPYSERSYLWRQKYMAKPLEVYPSILILPTVELDKSGVLITTGIESGSPQDDTVAFSRGAGGAVEGQAAESYLLRADGSHLLLRPSRETVYRTLPPTGGTARRTTSLDKRILSDKDLAMLRDMSQSLREKLAGIPGIGAGGPYDVELGFAGQRLWLFQVRPFVNNRWAQSSLYLRALDFVQHTDKIIDSAAPFSQLMETR